ncbi:MAG: methylated-DNA--[protein]-cysteine S-methyltransferase [Pseudomonadota bacterium]
MVELTADDSCLIGVRIDPADNGSSNIPAGHRLLQTAAIQMQEWFAGKRKSFDLPLAPLSTPRGKALRAGIAAINYGETLTYGELATQIGSAARAVGQACRRNPFPIIIPCHRVTSAGAQEFYSGGEGPRTKAWLIAFEQGKSYRYGSDLLI